MSSNPDKVQELHGLVAAFMKEFNANKRPIGWIEGYSEERLIEMKRAQREAKAGKKRRTK